MGKKSCIDKKITLEVLAEIREKCRQLPDMAHKERARRLAQDYPQFTARMLMEYSRFTLGATDKVFRMVMEGKLSLVALEGFISWEGKEQDYFADEYIEQKLTPTIMREVRRLRNEHADMGFDEAIARATGKIAPNQPRKGDQPKDLNAILTKIADQGARWRAMVSMALELIGDEEAAQGVHWAVFEKTFLLRQIVGEQYDFVNSRLQRYMNALKKRYRQAEKVAGSPAVEGRNGAPSPAGDGEEIVE